MKLPWGQVILFLLIMYPKNPMWQNMDATIDQQRFKADKAYFKDYCDVDTRNHFEVFATSKCKERPDCNMECVKISIFTTLKNMDKLN